MGLVLCGCSVRTDVAVYDSKKAEATADKFFDNLRDQDTAAAYELLTPARRAQATEAAFAVSVAHVAQAPAGPITGHETLSSSLVSSKPVTVQAVVRIDYQHGPSQTTGVLVVRQDDDTWRVDLGAGTG